MRLAVVTAVLLLVGILNTVTTVHGNSVWTFCQDNFPERPCGDRWSRIDDNRCAKFFDSPKTFNDAREHCRTFDSNLVSIHNNFERLYTNCIALGDDYECPSFWIGARRSGENFAHIDGTDFDYPGWYYPERNNYGGEEDCVESRGIKSGIWNDVDSMTKNYFVCAREM